MSHFKVTLSRCGLDKTCIHVWLDCILKPKRYWVGIYAHFESECNS